MGFERTLLDRLFPQHIYVLMPAILPYRCEHCLHRYPATFQNLHEMAALVQQHPGYMGFLISGSALAQ